MCHIKAQNMIDMTSMIATVLYNRNTPENGIVRQTGELISSFQKNDYKQKRFDQSSYVRTII